MSSSTTFLLLKLPLLALNRMLLVSEFHDLIHVSFSSKRMHWIIKNLQIKFETLETFVHRERTAVCLEVTRNGPRGKWIFNDYQFVRKFGEVPVTYSLNGIRLRTVSCPNDGSIYSRTYGNIQQSVKAGIEYLFDLFKCPLPCIFLRPDGILTSRRPILIGFHRCEKLFIFGDDEMRDDDLSKILEKIPVHGSLLITVPTSNNFIFNLGTCPKLNRIFISPGDWIAGEMLLNLNCSQIHIASDQITANDCRRFVKKWFDSDDTHLTYLCVSWSDKSPDDLYFDDLGLDLKEFNPEIRDGTFRNTTTEDVSEGLDFVRPADDLLATVIVFEYSFFFCVWHQRFQTVQEANIR